MKLLGEHKFKPSLYWALVALINISYVLASYSLGFEVCWHVGPFAPAHKICKVDNELGIIFCQNTAPEILEREFGLVV